MIRLTKILKSTFISGYYKIYNKQIYQIMDTIVDIILITPLEVMNYIAKASKEKRLFLNLSQQSLSEQSGVALSVIKKFEKTGKISLESLLKLSVPLNCLQDFMNLFKLKSIEDSLTLDDILKSEKTRKRGRG